MIQDGFSLFILKKKDMNYSLEYVMDRNLIEELYIHYPVYESYMDETEKNKGWINKKINLWNNEYLNYIIFECQGRVLCYDSNHFNARDYNEYNPLHNVYRSHGDNVYFIIESWFVSEYEEGYISMGTWQIEDGKFVNSKCYGIDFVIEDGE